MMDALNKSWPDRDLQEDALFRLAKDINEATSREYEELAPMEKRALETISYGVGNDGAAVILGVGVETLKTQLHVARLKLGAKTTTHAVAIALRQGLIQ